MEWRRRISHLYGRLGLGISAIVAAAVGVVVFVASTGVFAGATEDVTEHNGQSHQDASRLHFFTVHRSDLLVRASKVFTDIGAVPVVAVIAVIAAALFWRRGMRLAVVCAPVLALAVAGASVAVTKHFVGRARPPVSLHLVHESDASFPSGHATDSTAVLLTIALVCAVYVFRRPLVRTLTVAGAAFCTGAIGLSRLVLGVHWPTDVIAGWSLGLAVAVAATIATSLVARLSPPSAGPWARITRRRGGAAVCN